VATFQFEAIDYNTNYAYLSYLKLQNNNSEGEYTIKIDNTLGNPNKNTILFKILRTEDKTITDPREDLQTLIRTPLKDIHHIYIPAINETRYIVENKRTTQNPRDPRDQTLIDIPVPRSTSEWNELNRTKNSITIRMKKDVLYPFILFHNTLENIKLLWNNVEIPKENFVVLQYSRDYQSKVSQSNELKEYINNFGNNQNYYDTLKRDALNSLIASDIDSIKKNRSDVINISNMDGKSIAFFSL
jgi:hypothetical protein